MKLSNKVKVKASKATKAEWKLEIERKIGEDKMKTRNDNDEKGQTWDFSKQPQS